MDLIEIPAVETPHEELSLKDRPRKGPKKYEVAKVELPKNIQKFDRKVKVYKENPYNYNQVSLKKEKPLVAPSQTASQLITNPTYNTIGKFLGVDTIHDWERDYDKVYAIVEWARLKAGDDVRKIMKYLGQQSRVLPSVGNKNIDNLYIFARMKLNK